MKALQCDGHKLQVKPVPSPSTADDEALVRICKAGIYDTDQEIIEN